MADTASKSCEICYKPSTSVLVTPESKVSISSSITSVGTAKSFQDFFYVCPGHLKDRGFCSPIIDEAAVAAKKKKEMEAEVQRVKQEFEEKLKKKKDKEKEKEKEKEKSNDKDKDKDKDKKDDKDEKPEEKVSNSLLCPRSTCLNYSRKIQMER